MSTTRRAFVAGSASLIATAAVSSARAQPMARAPAGRYLGELQAGVAVFVDALWVMVFASYLLAVRRAPAGDASVVSTIETV